MNLRPEKREEFVGSYFDASTRNRVSYDLFQWYWVSPRDTRLCPDKTAELLFYGSRVKALLGNDLRSVGIKQLFGEDFLDEVEAQRGDWEFWLPRACQFKLLFPNEGDRVRLSESELSDMKEWILGYEDIKHDKTGNSLFYDWFLGYVGDLRVVAEDEAVADLVSRVSENKAIQEFDTGRKNFDRDGQKRFAATALALKIIYATKVDFSEFGLDIK